MSRYFTTFGARLRHFAANDDSGGNPNPGTPRDPWLWPFPSDWWGNIGVGSLANLVDAGITGTTKPKTDGINFSTDVNFALDTLTKKDYYMNGVGTVMGPSGGADFTVQVRLSPYLAEDGRMNGIAIFRDVNGKLWEVQPLLIDQTSTDPALQSPRASFAAVRGTDVTLAPVDGQHGGPNLTAMGLTIREWELDGKPGAIGHMLGINLPPQFIYRYSLNGKDQWGNAITGPDNTIGYRWPAKRADGGWNAASTTSKNVYAGTTPDMKLGAVMCVPVGYTAQRKAAGTLTHWAAIKVTQTIEDRGVILIDNAGGVAAGVVQFSIERTPAAKGVSGAEARWLALGSTFDTQLSTTVNDLQVIKNNSATAVNGGGTPIASELPPLAT